MRSWFHFAVWAVLGLAAYKTLIKHVSVGATPVLIMTIVSFCYFLAWASTLFLFHGDDNPLSSLSLDLSGVLIILSLAIAFFVSDYFLLRSYLAGAQLSVMTILMGLSMVIVVILGFFLFRERINFYQVLGLLLGVVSFVLLTWNDKA